MIMQKKFSLYQTDAFRYIIGYATALTGSQYFNDKYDCKIDTAYRIFADHIRTVVICLSQGIEFDANKKGFVLRKIYRRMLTYIYVYLLGKVEIVMNKPIIPVLVNEILNYYLYKNIDTSDICKKLIEEENHFAQKVSSLKKKYSRIIKKES